MSEVANIPQLRFSEFSGEWEEKKLGELCKFTQGVQIPFSEQLTKYKEGAIRYLYIRDFFTDDFPYYVKDQYPNKVIHTDEIMMVNTGNTAGKAFMGATGVLSNNAFKVSFDKTKVSNIFLFQRITSDTIQRRIKSFFNAGGQPHLGHKNIAIIPMGFASLKEQQKIAAFLTAVDNKIEQLSKKQELLKEYKKGLMQQIFSQATRFKADDGCDFPDWEEKKLGDVSVRGTSNISANQLEDNNGDYKIYGAAGHLKNIDFYTEEDCYVAIVKDGAGVGRIMLLESKTSVLGTLAIIKAKQGNDINFLYWLIQTINFRKYVVGSTIPHIYYRDYQAEKLRIPSLSEQAKIASFLSFIDSKIEQVGKQLDESKQFKKALLQQMFV